MFIPIPLQLKDGRCFEAIPVVNGLLIVSNILVFWLGWSLNFAMGADAGLFSPLTYAFAHYDVEHLVGNIWLLLVFGTPLNRRLGNCWYAMFYFGCTLALGLLAQFLVPTGLMGASGSIFAVMAAALLLMPSARLEIFYFALFPFTILVGLFIRPRHWVFWFVRWDRFSLQALWALVLVPLLELWDLFWTGWNWGNLGHLFGLVVGVAAVMLLPERITMRRASEPAFSTN